MEHFQYDPAEPVMLGCMWMLDADGNPINPPSLSAWSEFMADFERRRVAFDYVPDVGEVSTVFLPWGFPPLLRPDAPPELWETMVLLRSGERHIRQYATRAEAEAGHREMVQQFLLGGLN